MYIANLCLPTKYQFYSVLRYVYSRSSWEKKTLFVTIVLDSVYNFDQVEALEFIFILLLMHFLGCLLVAL